MITTSTSSPSPLGLVSNNAASLSAAFQARAFLGEHDTWDRSPVNGYIGKTAWRVTAAGQQRIEPR